MAYRLYIREHLFVVRWQAFTLDDADRIVTQVRLARVQQRRDVIYAGLQGDGVAEPDATVRKGLLARGVAVAKNAKYLHLVIDATGVRASVHRTIVRGIVGAARALKLEDVHKARLFGSVREMLQFDPDDLPASVDTLLRELDAAGVLAPDAGHAAARPTAPPGDVAPGRPDAPKDSAPKP
jgi:hypothetical protein